MFSNNLPHSHPSIYALIYSANLLVTETQSMFVASFCHMYIYIYIYILEYISANEMMLKRIFLNENRLRCFLHLSLCKLQSFSSFFLSVFLRDRRLVCLSFFPVVYWANASYACTKNLPHKYFGSRNTQRVYRLPKSLAALLTEVH